MTRNKNGIIRKEGKLRQTTEKRRGGEVKDRNKVWKKAKYFYFFQSTR